MHFWKAIIELLRRKLVAVPLLVSAIAAGLTGYLLTPLHYVSSTTMVLIPPTQGTVSKDPTARIALTNPMMSFSNNLKTASGILIQVMNTPEVAAEVGAVEDGPTKLTVDDGRTNPQLLDGNGPFVYVAGESTSARQAKDVVMRAQERIRRELVDRQKSLGAPPETYLTMADVVPPTTPKVTRTDRIKVGGVAFVLTLVFVLGIAYASQSVRASRQRSAGGELSLRPEDIELDMSQEQASQDDLDGAAEEWSSAKLAETVHPASADGEHRVQEGNRDTDVEPLVAPETQHANNEHPADDEKQVADEERDAASPKRAADGGLIGELKQPAEPEQVAYPAHPSQGWDLYIVQYPLAKSEDSPGSGGAEFDWSRDWGMDSLESERDSEMIGRRQRS